MRDISIRPIRRYEDDDLNNVIRLMDGEEDDNDENDEDNDDGLEGSHNHSF